MGEPHRVRVADQQDAAGKGAAGRDWRIVHRRIELPPLRGSSLHVCGDEHARERAADKSKIAELEASVATWKACATDADGRGRKTVNEARARIAELEARIVDSDAQSSELIKNLSRECDEARKSSGT